ncbi:hypothetical protein GGR53DRAFT_466570 [Hypoxylon sp. FL1150]|nr:hypothetical protein GGR53DRAFT_466570 [Hypoxylon sp. FL1150]
MNRYPMAGELAAAASEILVATEVLASLSPKRSRQPPQMQNLEAEVFCLGLDKLGILIQFTRGLLLPEFEFEELHDMPKECVSSKLLRDAIVGPDEAAGIC